MENQYLGVSVSVCMAEWLGCVSYLMCAHGSVYILVCTQE